MRRALPGVLEFAGAVLTVGLVGYAVVGPGAVLTVAALAVLFYAVLARERHRRRRVVGHLFVAISAGLCGVLLLAALQDGRLVVEGPADPTPLVERIVVAIVMFGLLGACAGFAWHLAGLPEHKAAAWRILTASTLIGLVFLGLQRQVAGGPVAPLWSSVNAVYLATFLTGGAAGLALLAGVHLLGRPVGVEVRRGIHEFRRVRPYLLTMVRPVEAIVFLYLATAILFACLYTSAYRIDPALTFSTTGRDALAFGDFLYFSLTTLATVGYGDIAPTSALTRALVGMEMLLSAFFLVVTFAGLTAYLQQHWQGLGGPRPRPRLGRSLVPRRRRGRRSRRPARRPPAAAGVRDAER